MAGSDEGGRVPVRLKTGGNLRRELAEGNHRSVLKYKGKVLRKAVSEVAVSRAMVFKVEDAAYIQG